MAEIVLVRQAAAVISDADREAVRRVLFGVIDGLSERHKKTWRQLWRWFLEHAEPGEMLELRTHRERLGWYHRKHMAMEVRVFQAQERIASFEQFRNWLKVGSGFCDWMAGPKGGVIPVPRSISYARLEQDAMEAFHADAVAFLRTEHAIKYLWPALPAPQRADAMEAILSEFDE